MGYVPNEEAALIARGAAAVDMNGLVVRGEKLEADNGWMRYEDRLPAITNPLPLGHTGAGAGQTNSANPLPIVRLDFFERANVAVNGIHHMAVSAREVGAAVNESSYVYVYPTAGGSAGQWNVVNPFDTATAARTLATGEKNDVVDSAAYPPADMWIFTNNTDNVMGYPINSTTTYDNMTGPGGAPAPPSWFTNGNFLARSVGVADERVLFLNTTENSVVNPVRVRWTTLGWSRTGTTAANNTVFTDPGSGAIDLIEFERPGVCVRMIGDKVVLYFEDGVAFLERTLLATRPFRKRIVTRRRGLLGTHAVVDLGDGIHFGIFTDGWYFLSASGEWKEAGLIRQGDTTERKFARRFYEELDMLQKHRIAIEYDAERKYIYIAFPGHRAANFGTANGEQNGDPDNVWIYDIRGDRVFIDTQNYLTIFGGDDLTSATYNQLPLCWNRFREVEQAETTWDDLVGVWDAQTESWNDFATTLGEERLVHGTRFGMVYQHTQGRISRETLTQDVSPTYFWEQHPLHGGAIDQYKTLNRVYLEYEQQILPQATKTTTNTVTITVKDGLSLDTLQQTDVRVDGGNLGGVGTANASFHAASTHPVIRISGTHPVRLRSWREEYLIEGGTEQEDLA